MAQLVIGIDNRALGEYNGIDIASSWLASVGIDSRALGDWVGE
jgi:hypothetical protein